MKTVINQSAIVNKSMKFDLLRKVLLRAGFALTVFLFASSLNAQKFAFVDTEYILKRVPAYEAAQEQLNLSSQKWQQEVEKAFQDVSALYKSYQTESVFLSAEMKTQRENEIVEKEKQAKLLQQKYFGNEGELFKKRESLIKPIQDEVYSAISSVAAEKTLSVVFDKSSNVGVLFSDPKIDVSDDVLKQMGL